MPRRETILRDDLDGGKRLHEVELRIWKVTAEDGRSVTFETESAYLAREKARTLLQAHTLKIEEAEDGTVLFTDGDGKPLVSTPATPEELRRSAEIMAEHEVRQEIPVEEAAKVLEMMSDGASKNCLVSGELAEKMGLTPEPEPPARTALERMKRRAGGK